MRKPLPENWTEVLAESIDRQAARPVDWDRVKNRHRKKLLRRVFGSLGAVAAAAALSWGLVAFVGEASVPAGATQITAEWYSDSLDSAYTELDAIFAMTVAMMGEE